MGSTDDIMHEFVKKELKRLYPSVDGWQIRQARTTGKEQGFVVSRRILGKAEGAHILVSFDRIVSPPTMETLAAMSQSEPIPGLAAPKKILVVPKNTKLPSVPGEVTVLPMQSFAWEEKELVWLKRRAQMSEKATAAKSS
ncbi:MAG: hypothetical protein HGA55_01930 [Methanoregulaceae archaeon]|nr:hypothetical protein [Methanoregulaceae archaeon]